MSSSCSQKFVTAMGFSTENIKESDIIVQKNQFEINRGFLQFRTNVGSIWQN